MVILQKKGIIILFLPLFLVGLFLWHHYEGHTAVKEETLHVFLEAYATNPALSQMIIYAQLPKDSPKLIAWHRFPKRAAIINLKQYNTEEISLAKAEGHWEESAQCVLKKVLKRMKKNPLLNVELHLNMWKTETTIRPFLKAIPPTKIKKIHLYEDGYGDIFKLDLLTKNQPTEYTKKQVADGIENEKNWEWLMIFSLHKLYPTRYHLFNAPEIRKHPFFQKLDIEDINFWDLNKTLTPTQKLLIYKLCGFDYLYYENLLKNKKFIIFLLGYSSHKITDLLVKITTDKKFSQVDYNDYLWLFKPHPSYDASKKELKIAKEVFLNAIEEIPSQVPIELFILSGLSPTFICGYSSSAFYSFRKENILFIIDNENKSYKNYYINFIKLSDKNILNLDKL